MLIAIQKNTEYHTRPITVRSDTELMQSVCHGMTQTAIYMKRKWCSDSLCNFLAVTWVGSTGTTQSVWLVQLCSTTQYSHAEEMELISLHVQHNCNILQGSKQ